MELIKKIYLRIYLFTFLFYLLFNKGVAYTYFVELVWISGIILIIIDRKNYFILYNNKIKFLIYFIILSFVYIIINSFQYNFVNVIRDSFIFLYALFIFILFLYIREKDFIWESILKFYKFFPFVVFFNFLLQFFVKELENLNIFGNVPILLYKYGDMGVHLMITSLFFIINYERISKKFRFLYFLLIVLDFLIIASYSRSGMLSFTLGIIIFIFFCNHSINFNFKIFKKIFFAVLLLSPILFLIQVKENFQGRTLGITQITQNINSVVGSVDNETLENNEIWRLIWWGKIIEYSFTKEHIFIGKGFGLSLSQTDDVNALEDLRSPHNFHLTILARFGVILFILWIYWIFILVKPLFNKQLSDKESILTIIIVSFLINSTFDVYLEGPMGAFPFWTFVGLLFIEDYYKPNEIPT